MVVTVVGKNYTQISSCDTTSSGGIWSTGTVDSEQLREGVASLCATVKNAGLQTITFTPSAAVDLSGMKHLRMWFIGNQGAKIDTLINGGIQLWISDGTNTGYYYVSGSDVYVGGWINLCVDVSRAVDSGTKPSSMNAITSLGFRLNMLSSSKNAVNTWWDNICACDGLSVYGDDSGGYFDFDDIWAVDNATSGGWGIIRKIAGTYLLTGSLDFGGATSITKFQAKSQVVVFEDRKVNSALYAFNITDSGNESYTTEFILGSKSGSAGIEGCLIRVQDITQTAKYVIDGSTDIDVDNFKLYGSTFLDAGSIFLPSTATDIEVLNCNFESCGPITVSTCKVENSNVVSPNDVGMLISSEAHEITACTYINCIHAIEFDTSGTYSLVDMTFIGGDGTTYYDIENSSVGLVTINSTDSNPAYYENTGGGSTVINNSVILKVTVKDSNGAGILGARVLIEADAGGAAPHDESVTIVSTGTTATATHSAHGMATGEMVIIRGANEQYYNGVFAITYVSVDSYTYTMGGDPNDTATGTITATQAFMSELTIAGGIAEQSFNAGATQPYTGVARKSSSSPYYRDASFSGTDCSGGIDIPIQMESDE